MAVPTPAKAKIAAIQKKKKKNPPKQNKKKKKKKKKISNKEWFLKLLKSSIP